MQELALKPSRRFRKPFYVFLLFVTSCIVGFYFNSSYILYLAFGLIFLSIFYELKKDSSTVQSIILPDGPDDSFSIVVSNKDSSFWRVRKYIVINSWIYIDIVQEGSNKKIKLWLHKSNFVNKNHIRDLARYIIFSK